MENDKILNIALLGKSTRSDWIYPIINEINQVNEVLEKYQKSDAREWGISISIKLDMINVLEHNIYNEESKIRRILKENIKEVDECIDKNLAYCKLNTIPLLTYIECLFFEMQSTIDILIKYALCLLDITLGKGMKKSAFLKECKCDKREILLSNIRNDLIHNYAGWISFKKLDGEFDLMIEMPIIKKPAYKKYNHSFISRQSIKELFKDFNNFIEATRTILLKKIQENAEASPTKQPRKLSR